MKKTVIVLLALFLALPAVSFAGSATSRWDMTIGGYVKFDMGVASQNQGVDAYVAQPKGNGPYTNINDQVGSNFYSYAGETRVNMLTRGPDAWGAKTSAFIEGDFRGGSTTGGGQFGLRHAFMTFDWPTTKLIIGQTWQKWGFLPTFAGTLVEYNGLGPFLKGLRQPTIRLEQTFAKNWNFSVAVSSPTNTLSGASGGTVDSFTNATYPFFEGSFGFTTDKCGKIGAWQMLFNLEGFYGQQQYYKANSSSTYFTSDTVNSWGIAFKGFIPIIPEKKGNKAGAFSTSGVLFYTQNPGWYQGPVTTNSYPTNTTWLSLSSPITFGGWGSLSYYFTDKLYITGWYGYTRNELSNAAMSGLLTTSAGTTAVSAIQNTTQMIANISYDVNAAIRFGLEGAYFNTRYASPYVAEKTGAFAGIPISQKDGEYYTIRVGAFYFF